MTVTPPNAWLPRGALVSVADASLAEPFCYISALQAAWCVRVSLADLVPHLPCWVPQRLASVAAFGEDAERIVEAATARHGPWVWATEFSNVHTTFAFEEPGFTIGGVRYAGPEEYFQLAKSEGMPDHDDAVAAMARCRGPAEAFHVGRAHGMRPDWDAVRVDVMRVALEAKFTQSAALGALLVSTGSHPLVQIKAGDAHWGTGPDGRGRNALGTLLVALRDRLRAAIDADSTGR